MLDCPHSAHVSFTNIKTFTMASLIQNDVPRVMGADGVSGTESAKVEIFSNMQDAHSDRPLMTDHGNTLSNLSNGSRMHQTNHCSSPAEGPDRQKEGIKSYFPSPSHANMF